MDDKNFLKEVDSYLESNNTPAIIKFTLIDIKKRHGAYYGRYFAEKNDIKKYIGNITRQEARNIDAARRLHA